MSDHKDLDLPIPHIETDGSVNELHIAHYEDREWLSICNSASSIVIASPDHARALARALVIAANFIDKQMGN